MTENGGEGFIGNRLNVSGVIFGSDCPVIGNGNIFRGRFYGNLAL